MGLRIQILILLLPVLIEGQFGRQRPRPPLPELRRPERQPQQQPSQNRSGISFEVLVIYVQVVYCQINIFFHHQLTQCATND